MAGTPFKMKGWSPFTKKSPAKDDPHTTTETHKTHETETKTHELTGTINDAGTRVIDETGKWTGVGDRPDLASKEQIAKAIATGKPKGWLKRQKVVEE